MAEAQTSNLRLVVDNFITSATISVISGTEEATLPATNLQNYSKAAYSRVNVVGGAAGVATYRVDMSSPTALSAIVLGPSNFDSDTTIEVNLYNNSDVLLDTITKIDVAPLVPFGTFVWGIDPLGSVFTNKFTTAIWFDSVPNVSHFTVSITGSNVSHYNVAYMYAGIYLEPNRDPSRGLEMQYVDTGELNRTEDGSLRSTSGILYRKYNLSLEFMEESDRLMILRFINKRRPFIISMFQRTPTNGASIHMETDYTALVKMIGDFGVSSRFYGLYDTTLSIEEV
jgi:hypothetical protein